MNQIGLIMGWQFVKTTSIDEVESLLVGIKNRVEEGENLTIIVDNCCGIQEKLMNMFGANVMIKLDLFHAIQRITKKMPKRHPYYHLCISDLRLVFRRPSDLGRERTQSTPDSNELIENLNRFEKKWARMDISGWKILNDHVYKEIESLKVHIRKGCLSNIPVGLGTNRNERLHRHIKPHFSHTRLGLSLALALMTVLFYQYNSRYLQKVTRKPRKPIWYQNATTNIDTTSDNFGIVDKHVQENILWGNNTTSDLTFLTSSDFDAVAKTLQVHDTISHLISVEEIVDILKNAIHLYNTTKSMTSKSGSS